MNAGERIDPSQTDRWKRAVKPDAPQPRTEADDPAAPAPDEGPATVPDLALEPEFPSTVEPPLGPEQPISPTIDPDGFAPGGASYRTRRALPEIPGFLVLDELGMGGMGVVYKAQRLKLNRACAIKMVRAGRHADDRAMQRFLGEAEAIAKLKHPNVVQIYSIGESEGLPYLELEYVEGGSLAARLDGVPWHCRRAAELIRALARGISAAHASGLIHRDLKPGNVLLTDDGAPKVADFGLAKAWEADSHLTATGSIVGTPSYMPPEQAEGLGRDIDPAVDIYGLGAIFFELLTGRPPFRGATLLETLEQVRWADPVRPSRLVPGIPRDAETICLKCLRKRPRDRYASAEDLGEDLRRFLAREPILARPVSSLERGAKWARRRPGAAALLAALIVTLVSLIALGAWSYRQISQSYREISLAYEDAKEARAGAVDEAYRALVSETRALRLGHPLGWRRDALRNLGRLATMEAAGRDPVQLRTEAVACLSEIDLREVARFEAGGDLRSLDFRADGQVLATAHYDGRLRLWDPIRMRHLRVLDDPNIVHSQMYGVLAPMPAVRFRPGTNALAYATWGRDVAWHDPHRCRPPIPGRGQATSIAFDGRGGLLAIGWMGGWTSLHDAETGRASRVIESGGDDWHNPVALSPDGGWLAMSGPEHAVQLYRVGQPEEPPIVLGRHADLIRSLAFSPDGGTLISASLDNTAKLWDVGRREERLALLGHTARLNGAAFHPEGHLIATVGDDETLRLWDAHTGIPLMTLNPGVGTILAVDFSPDGDRLACGHDTICLFAIDGRRERRYLRGHTVEVPDVGFHAAEPLIVTGSSDCEVHAWDPGGGRLLHRHPEPSMVLECLAVSPKGRFVAIGPGKAGSSFNFDYRVPYWDLQSGPPGRYFEGHSANVMALTFDKAGERLASGGGDGRLLVWEEGTGRVLWQGSSGGEGIVSLAFCDGGRALLATDSDGIALHGLDDGGIVRRVRIEGGASRSALSADEKLLYVGGRGGDLYLYRLPDLAKLAHLEQGHSGAVRGIALASGGALLATGGDDHRIVIRDARTLAELFSLPPHDGAIYRLAFGPHGSQLAVAGVEKRVTVWDFAVLQPQLSGLGLSWVDSSPKSPSERGSKPEILRIAGPLSPVDRAWAQMGEGEGLRGRGEFEAAFEPYQHARALWEEILREHPDEPFFRSERAVTLAAQADLHARAGREEEGKRLIHRALEVIGTLDDADPRVAFNAGRVLTLAGGVERDPGRHEQAIRRLRRALAAGFSDDGPLNYNVDLDPLRGRPDFPALVPGALRNYGWPYYLRRAMVPGRLFSGEALIADAGRALELLQALIAEGPDDPWLRRHASSARIALAAALHGSGMPTAGAGDWAGAVDALAGEDRLDAAESVMLARGCALLYRDVGDEVHATRALAALRAGLESDFGRFLESAAAEHVFDPLRDRDDFPALTGTAFPADPFAAPLPEVR